MSQEQHPLQFILGRAGCDHFGKLMKKLTDDYRQHPHDHFFYLVPNHIKFKSEINTLNYLRKALKKGDGPFAQINVQILSLTRMGWFFFNQAVMPQHPLISNSGVNMLLYALIQDHAKELKLFYQEIDHPGFIQKIAQEISEMQTSQISPDALNTLYQQYKTSNWNHNLLAKTHDFLIIYKAFIKETDHQYISKAGVLNQLCDYLAHHDLSRDHFYIGGFSHFTAQENHLIKILIRRSAGVVIDLNLDPKDKQVNVHLKPYNLFYQPKLLYSRLCAYSRGLQRHKGSSSQLQFDVSINEDNENSENYYPRINDDLKQLENYWIDAYEKHVIPGKYKDSLKDKSSVQIIQADNTYSELANVAVKIRQMVAMGKYRYSDFLILTRHLDKFKNIIKPIFNLQQIPIFDDLQKQMVLHPLVRLIGDLFSIYSPDSTHNYQYRDVIDLLKTGLLKPKVKPDKKNKDDNQNPDDPMDTYMPNDEYYDDLYLCENCVLQNGYWGKKWIDDDDWQYTQYNDIEQKTESDPKVNQKINVIRHFIKDTLPPFYKKLATAKTCKDAAKILYNFLDQNGVIHQLKSWRTEELKKHQLAYAGQNNQVWSVFCALLDNFVEILGDHPFKWDNFWSLLHAGFEAASYSQVPPTFDQVVISESKIVQTKSYKVVFMIGSTDDVMPDHIVNDSLFSNTDRDHLNHSLDTFNQNQGTQCYLDEDSEHQTNNEPYLNYIAFMSATQKVIFTYSLKSEDESNGSGIDVSPYVKQIAEAFNIHVQHPTMMPVIQPIKGNDDQYQLTSVNPYLGSRLGTLRHLVQAKYVVHNYSQELPTDWQYVKDLLIDEPQDKPKTDLDGHIASLTTKLLNSVNYSNQPQPLDHNYALKLYGKSLNLSTSQLESFYDDPYEYFLHYGLRLKPRQILGRSLSISSGLFYHEALRGVIQTIINKNVKLENYTPEKLYSYVDDEVDKISHSSKKLQYEILRSSNRMNYVKDQLKSTIKAMVYTIYLQSKHYTDVRPVYTEMPFKRSRDKYSLAPLSFNVQSMKYRFNRRVTVDGRIDRIDKFVDPKTASQYFGLIDYKSSPHQFNYGEILAGTQMQMMTYLDVLYKNLPDLQKISPNSKYTPHLFGALYSMIQNPFLTPSKPKDLKNIMRSQKQNQLWKMLLGEQQYNGILIDENNIPDLMDTNLRKTRHSMLYKSLNQKRNGDFYAYSKPYLMTPDQFNVIRSWTEDLIKNAGKLIYSGYDKLNPVQFPGHRSFLKYSPYKPVMCFDPLIKDNRYNPVDTIKNPEDLVAMIKQRENGKEN